jgi:TonB-dependent starch-binding outer membrane protein SusC
MLEQSWLSVLPAKGLGNLKRRAVLLIINSQNELQIMKKNLTRSVVIAIMKFSIIPALLFAFAFCSYAKDTNAQDLLKKRISLKIKAEEVRSILSEIERLSGGKFMYSPEIIQSSRKVSIVARNEQMANVLSRLLQPLGIRYEVVNNYIILRRKNDVIGVIYPEISGTNTPVKTIRGKVTASTGEPLSGVSITSKNAKFATTTDNGGDFILNVDENVETLVFTHVGFLPVEISIVNKETLAIVLEADAKNLADVVVVGYGQVKKNDVTGSVSTVQVKEMKKVAVTSLDQALQGRAAGVQITQNSGAPGGSTTIRIRGGNSIQGDNEPLYVIDGVPFKNDGVSNGSSFNVLSTLNPGDIESVTILKDASSTAIYGSRGANGVVIITTKRGKAGAPNLTFETYYGVQKVRRKYPVLNTREYAAFLNDVNTNDGKPPVFSQTQIDSIGSGVDWQDQIFRTAPIANYQLSMNGGDEKTQYAMSGGYFTQDGVVKNSDFKRYSFRINLDRKINNRLKIGNSLSINRTLTNQSRTDRDLGGAGQVTIAALQFPPIVPIRNRDGSYVITNPYLNFTADNPVALALDSKNENSVYRIFGNVFGEYKILEGLNLRVVVGADGILQKQSSYLPRTVSSGLSQGGAAAISNVESLTWINENLLTYNKTINLIHSFNFLAGFTQQANKTQFNSSGSRNFVDDNLGYNNLGLGSVSSVPGSSVGTWGLRSFLGRVNYNFKNKYLATASIRADGSSRFGKNNRYANFPSGAVAWKIMEEPFMQQQKLFSDLKLRLSYGLTGNQDGVGNYPAYSLLGTQNYVLGNVTATGVGPSQIANPDLSWETTSQANVGLDMSLFNGRVSITADAYLKKTHDLLLNLTIPSTSGFTSAIKNLGKVENKGVELNIFSRNITGEFQWTTDFNIATNKNTVLDIGGAAQIFAGEVANIAQNVNSGIIRVGQPLGSFYGYVTNGLYQSTAELTSLSDAQAKKPGDRKYLDLNKDNVINDLDRTIIGYAQPKYIGGITNNFSYKGIELSVFFQGVYGNDILNANRFELEYLNGTNNQDKDMIRRWTPANTNTDIPRATASRPANRISTRQIEDGSYLRLKNLQLAYSIPSNALQFLKVQSIRIYASAQNFITWTNYSGFDPEVNRFGQDSRSQGFDYSGYPAAKTIFFGLNVSF